MCIRDRRSHAVATPRGGGLAVVVAVLVVIAALVLRMPREIVLLACAGIGLLLVAGIGWLDDHRPLPPWPKLATHMLAAGWLAAGFFLSGAGPWVALAAVSYTHLDVYKRQLFALAFLASGVALGVLNDGATTVDLGVVRLQAGLGVILLCTLLALSLIHI